MKCKIYHKIEWHNKLLVPKLNFMWKHDGRKRAIDTILGVIVTRQYYILKTINMCSMNNYMCQGARIL